MSLNKISHSLAAILLLGSVAFAQNKTVTVEEVMKNPSKFVGQIKVVGVVESVVANKTIVLKSEPCCASCPTVKLNVTWKGATPMLKQRAVVEGKFNVTKKGAKQTVVLTAAKVGKA